jgi:phenylacetate-CoA ligase
MLSEVPVDCLQSQLSRCQQLSFYREYFADAGVDPDKIDPDTGTVLPEGERGELVVTHLNKESMPLVRYRTGDLTMVETVQCGDRETLTLPRSVFGRVDNMTKVKRVEFFPEELAGLVANVDGLTGEYQVVLTRENGVDHMQLVCEGDAPTEEIQSIVEGEVFQNLDNIETVADLDTSHTLKDERFND